MKVSHIAVKLIAAFCISVLTPIYVGAQTPDKTTVKKEDLKYKTKQLSTYELIAPSLQTFELSLVKPLSGIISARTPYVNPSLYLARSPISARFSTSLDFDYEKNIIAGESLGRFHTDLSFPADYADRSLANNQISLIMLPVKGKKYRIKIQIKSGEARIAKTFEKSFDGNLSLDLYTQKYANKSDYKLIKSQNVPFVLAYDGPGTFVHRPRKIPQLTKQEVEFTFTATEALQHRFNIGVNLTFDGFPTYNDSMRYDSASASFEVGNIEVLEVQ